MIDFKFEGRIQDFIMRSDNLVIFTLDTGERNDPLRIMLKNQHAHEAMTKAGIGTQIQVSGSFILNQRTNDFGRRIKEIVFYGFGVNYKEAKAV